MPNEPACGRRGHKVQIITEKYSYQSKVTQFGTDKRVIKFSIVLTLQRDQCWQSTVHTVREKNRSLRYYSRIRWL